MASFGTASRKKLETCNDSLVTICELAIEVYDFSVLEGHRSDKRQEELFRQGKSKLRAGQSKHNQNPSLAVDIAPWPIDWNDINRFFFLSGLMFQAAHDLNVKIRWGMDWNQNFDFTDQSFFDAPHFELLGEMK